jgi:tripartite-type tricarboxylate transporter receptor subunit TctC
MKQSRRSSVLALAGLTAAATLPAVASEYPDKPVRLVVPWPAGGLVDIAARTSGTTLQAALGQPFVVENRPGAGGSIGADAVAKAAPDGYTLLLTTSALNMNAAIKRTPSYSVANEFIPIAAVAYAPSVLVVRSALGVSSVQELIALAKSKPDKLSYASAGQGSPAHLYGELLKSMAGVEMLHVPYKGAAPASTALLAGEMQISFSTPTNTFPYVKAGKLRALAVSTPKRSIFAPELPTLAEQGLAGFEFSSWTAVLAPTGTPKETIQKMYEALQKVTAAADIREKFFLQGMEVVGSSPEQTADFIRQDVTRSAKIIRENNITAD